MENTRPHSSRPNRQGISKASLLILLVIGSVATYFVGDYFEWKMPGRGKSTGPRIIKHVVENGSFVLDAVERGEVESFDNVEVKCLVKSGKGSSLKILEVLDEGSVVKKDDIILKLDSAALEQELISQQIVCNTKEAALITSRNEFESAKISIDEYEQGTFFQEEQTAQAAIFIAEEDLRKAKEYANYSERLSARGYVTQQQLDGDRFAVDKARTELRTAKTTLRVLQELTKPKQMLTFESAIKSTEAAWEADKNSLELELDKLEELKQEIDKCVIRAPQDGQIIYANRASSRAGAEFIVEEGSEVRENQVIVRMPSSNAMQVKAKVNESRVNAVHPGLKATIRIDAFGDREIKGEVTKVNEYPEPTSWYQSQTKEYATEVRILENIPGVRPGLTAEATIHIDREDSANLIPIQCIYERGRRTWCFRQTGEGDDPSNWEAVEITIKGNNDKYCTVEDAPGGVEKGNVLALNPPALAEYMNLPEPDRPDTSREALGAAGRPERGGSGGGGRPAGAGGGRPGGAGGGKPAGAGGGGRPSGTGGGKPAGAGGGRPSGAGGGKPAGAGGGRGANKDAATDTKVGYGSRPQSSETS